MFNNFASTVEGEFQVKLGHLLAREKDKGGLQMQETKKAPLVYVPADDETYGIRNWNSNQKMMYLLCQFFPPIPTSGRCWDPVKPMGHCFPVCGATLDFAAHEIKFADMALAIRAAEEELGTAEIIFVALERTNDDAMSMEYQVSLLPIESHGFFDEELYKRLAHTIKAKLFELSVSHYSFSNFRLRLSRTDFTPSRVAKILGTALFCMLMLGTFLWYHWRTGTYRRFTATRNLLPNIPVLFSRKKSEDVVELLPSDPKESTFPEDPYVNLNFEEHEEENEENLASEVEEIEPHTVAVRSNDTELTLLDF
ncbi:unnamed protein product, partial [Mesorhabditis spiculigera]